MLNFFKKQSSVQILLIEIFLIFISFWFLLKGLKTDGVWETVILNLLFFLVFPFFVFRYQQKEKTIEIERKQKIKVVSQVIGFWLIFLSSLFLFSDWSFLRLNYLSRTKWFLGDWWVLVFLDIVLLPIILCSQEFFFRKFIIEESEKDLSWKGALIFQALVFTVFEIFFFGLFSWKFILFDFTLALLLGIFYMQTRSIYYSFFARWMAILSVEGFILYKIQSIKF